MDYIVVTSIVKGGFVAQAIEVRDGRLVRNVKCTDVSPTRAVAKSDLSHQMNGNNRIPATGNWRLE